jgi:hypothetical protein
LLLVLVEVKRSLAEAFLRQFLVRRTEAVLVTTTVVCSDLPDDFDLLANCPGTDAKGGILLEHFGPAVSMFGMGSLSIFTPFGDIITPRSATSETTCISHWSIARGTPWIVLVNV